MKTLTILGSTGSIGTNTLDVVRRNRHRYQVYALVAGQNVELLAAQILEFRPKRGGGRDRRRRWTRLTASAGGVRACRARNGRSWLRGDAARVAGCDGAGSRIP